MLLKKHTGKARREMYPHTIYIDAKLQITKILKQSFAIYADTLEKRQVAQWPFKNKFRLCKNLPIKNITKKTEHI